MSRTTTEIRGKEYPKSKKTERIHTPKNASNKKFLKKFFGFTSGTHSQFEAVKAEYKKAFESNPDCRQCVRNWNSVKDVTFMVKGKDFVKYGYGNGTKKEKRVKNYKKEIE